MSDGRVTEARSGRVLLLCCAAMCVVLPILGPASAQRNQGQDPITRWITRQVIAPLMSSMNLLSRVGRPMGPPPYPVPPPGPLELCRMRGYLCEHHTVTTEDGYILSLFRVVGNEGGTPVLMQHGMTSTAEGFICRNSSNLAFILHDAGYDIWLGNYRGSPHSRRHVNLTTDSAEYWNFSWHEMGLYDLPAKIDYILGVTGFPSMFHVGHSMGTTGLLVLLSSRPEYNQKIRLGVLMAPSAYVTPSKQPIAKMLTQLYAPIKGLLKRAETHELMTHSHMLHMIVNVLCRGMVDARGPCLMEVQNALGDSPDQIIPDLVPMLVAYHPAGVAVRCLEHYVAIQQSGLFRPLGKGVDDPNPGPEYNLSAISAPMTLIHGKTDAVLMPREVRKLASRLPNLERLHLVEREQFNHIDYLYGKEADTLVYKVIMDAMQSIENNLIK